jgi:hypothetical protein
MLLTLRLQEKLQMKDTRPLQPFNVLGQRKQLLKLKVLQSNCQPHNPALPISMLSHLNFNQRLWFPFKRSIGSDGLRFTINPQSSRKT